MSKNAENPFDIEEFRSLLSPTITFTLEDFMVDLAAFDSLGRLLFTFYARPAEFAARYSPADLVEIESSLRDLLETLGDAILEAKTANDVESLREFFDIAAKHVFSFREKCQRPVVTAG